MSIVCGECFDEREPLKQQLAALKAKLDEAEMLKRASDDRLRVAGIQMAAVESRLRTVEASAAEMRAWLKEAQDHGCGCIHGGKQLPIPDTGKGYLSPAEVEKKVREARAEAFVESSNIVFRNGPFREATNIARQLGELARREREGLKSYSDQVSEKPSIEEQDGEQQI